MAFPTSVNDQITDSVKGETVPDAAASDSIAGLYAALEQSVHNLYQHAVDALQHLHSMHAELTEAGVELPPAGVPGAASVSGATGTSGAGTTAAADTATFAEVNDALDTALNSQITDSAAQANVKVPGEAPFVITGNLYQATAQALSNAAHNATNAQQQANALTQAATTQGVIALLSVDTAATGEALQKVSG